MWLRCSCEEEAPDPAFASRHFDFREAHPFPVASTGRNLGEFSSRETRRVTTASVVGWAHKESQAVVQGNQTGDELSALDLKLGASQIVVFAAVSRTHTLQGRSLGALQALVLTQGATAAFCIDRIRGYATLENQCGCRRASTWSSCTIRGGNHNHGRAWVLYKGFHVSFVEEEEASLRGVTQKALPFARKARNLP